MKKIIFWDYDGTLIDSEIIYKNSLISFLKEKHLELKEIDDEFFYKNIAGHHPESFLLKLEKNGFIKNCKTINPNEIREYYTYYFSLLENGKIKVIDNIDKIIAKLAQYKDIYMYITSSSLRNDFITKNSIVNNKILNSYFDIDKNVYLCGSIDKCNFKPSPDVFNYAFNDIINKNDFVLDKDDKLFIIEDSKAGCIAGKDFKIKYCEKINISIIGYIAGMKLDTYKKEYCDKLINSGADYVAKTSDDILKFIIN